MAKQRSSTQRRLIAGSTLGAGLLLSLALYGLVNYLSLRHYGRFDWTASKLYSLSDKSRNVVAGLDREIEAVIFLEEGSQLYTQADELLSRYEAVNPELFDKRVVDPVRNILEARRLVDRHAIDRGNVIVLATDSDRRVIDEADLVEYDYSGVQFGEGPKIREFKGEQLITSALLELVEAEKPKILFTVGHGEGQLDYGERSLSQARDLLGKDNFEIEEWGSLGKNEVPADTDLVVVAGPTTRFLEPELELFSRYLDGGGRMLLLLDPVFAPGGNDLLDLGLGDWLAGYGVEIRRDLVVEPSQQVPFYGAETFFANAFGSHPIVDPLAELATVTMWSEARSVSPAADPPAGREVAELVSTTADAWGETDLANLDQLGPGDDDTSGPVPLGVAVTFAAAEGGGHRAAGGEPAGDEAGAAETGDEPAPAEDELEAGLDVTDLAADEEDASAPEARLVVYGDFDFAADGQIANAANGMLLLNTLNWLVEREQLIDIENRPPTETKLSLTGGEIANLRLLVLFLLPGLAAVAGVWVYVQRRR